MCGGDAAFLSNYFGHLFLFLLLSVLSNKIQTEFALYSEQFNYTVSVSFVCGLQPLEPGSVSVMRRLEPGDPGVVNHKSPTTLLLDPEGEFHSFGFTARDYYHDLSPREAKNWLYFDKFKMALHNAKVTSYWHLRLIFLRTVI